MAPSVWRVACGVWKGRVDGAVLPPYSSCKTPVVIRGTIATINLSHNLPENPAAQRRTIPTPHTPHPTRPSSVPANPQASQSRAIGSEAR